MIRYSFIVYEAVGVSIVCWVEPASSSAQAWMESEGGSGLFCFRSGQQEPFSPWVLFGKILPQLPHKQMNSLASVLFFFLTCAKHWHFTELSWSSASKHPTVGKWMNLTCLHALKNTNPIFDVHFFFLSPIFLVIQIILHSTHLCFAATANQNDLSHKSAQLQGRVSVIYFWWLA